uniref:Uncharacterized protein n=1 Tax=Anopheles albimanus TaxID=7167 RepID=A0A8W7JEA7_ANOAL
MDQAAPGALPDGMRTVIPSSRGNFRAPVRALGALPNLVLPVPMSSLLLRRHSINLATATNAHLAPAAAAAGGAGASVNHDDDRGRRSRSGSIAFGFGAIEQQQKYEGKRRVIGPQVPNERGSTLLYTALAATPGRIPKFDGQRSTPRSPIAACWGSI